MVADILHPGHMIAIEEAKSKCDYLIVALHCCPVYKNPVQTIFERYMDLRAVKWIDEIIPYQNVEDAKNMLLSLNYDIYFLGEDYRNKDWECSDIVKSQNKEIIFLRRQHIFSSTYVKDKVINHGKVNNDGIQSQKVYNDTG